MTEVKYDPADAPNPLEAALLQWMVKFYQIPALAEQVQHCRVTMREYSGCGFFTTFVVPGNSSIIPPNTTITGEPFRYYDGPDIMAPELPHDAGSILFVKGGLLDFLEAYAYADGDPTGIETFELGRPPSMDK